MYRTVRQQHFQIYTLFGLSDGKWESVKRKKRINRVESTTVWIKEQTVKGEESGKFVSDYYD